MAGARRLLRHGDLNATVRWPMPLDHFRQGRGSTRGVVSVKRTCLGARNVTDRQARVAKHEGNGSRVVFVVRRGHGPKDVAHTNPAPSGVEVDASDAATIQDLVVHDMRREKGAPPGAPWVPHPQTFSFLSEPISVRGSYVIPVFSSVRCFELRGRIRTGSPGRRSERRFFPNA